jgi:hypothetical protein
LKLATQNSEIYIELDALTVNVIGMKCIARFPKLVPEPKPVEFEDCSLSND